MELWWTLSFTHYCLWITINIVSWYFIDRLILFIFIFIIIHLFIYLFLENNKETFRVELWVWFVIYNVVSFFMAMSPADIFYYGIIS